MKTKRNLSGVFIRSKNKDDGKWDNVCFEDLEQEEQDVWLDGLSKEQVSNLSKILACTLNEIGDQLDLTKE